MVWAPTAMESFNRRVRRGWQAHSPKFSAQAMDWNPETFYYSALKKKNLISCSHRSARAKSNPKVWSLGLSNYNINWILTRAFNANIRYQSLKGGTPKNYSGDYPEYPEPPSLSEHPLPVEAVLLPLWGKADLALTEDSFSEVTWGNSCASEAHFPRSFCLPLFTS